MNNNQMNFDPMTGQPINNNPVPTAPVNPIPNVQPIPIEQQVTTIESQPIIQQPTNNTYINPQQQMQGIATVEQDKQQFIQNTQASTVVKKEEKKEGPNIGFIITLFIIILASILFLFPYLMKVLG